MRKMLLITQSEISSGMDFIEKGLTEFEIGKKQCLKTMLVAEESLQKLIMNAENEDDKICVALNKRMGSVYVSMTLRGRAFELIQGDTVEDVLHIEQDDQQTGFEKEEEMIRNILLRANKEQLRYKNKKGMNMVEITVRKNPHAMVMRTMFALVAVFKCFENGCGTGGVLFYCFLYFPIWRFKGSGPDRRQDYEFLYVDNDIGYYIGNGSFLSASSGQPGTGF